MKVPPELLKFARELRKGQTNAERLLWHCLRRRSLTGFKFRRQQPLGPYIVDFCCFEKKLIIELDGSQHMDDKVRDDKRTKYFEEKGYRVFRFWNNDVLARTESVLQLIWSVLN